MRSAADILSVGAQRGCDIASSEATGSTEAAARLGRLRRCSDLGSGRDNSKKPPAQSAASAPQLAIVVRTPSTATVRCCGNPQALSPGFALCNAADGADGGSLKPCSHSPGGADLRAYALHPSDVESKLQR
jgi:hypothetical protein